MIRLAFSAMLLCQVQGHAQAGPKPPCGEETVPSYPGLDDRPIAKFWSEAEAGRDWRPPVCSGWSGTGFSTLITTAARFRYPAGSDALLRRIGAISELTGMRYWSTTHKQWQTLIVSAHALTGPRAGKRREDFELDEMQEGSVLYLEQADNLSGNGIFRMQINKASADRIVVAVENASRMHYFLLTLFSPGEMQSVYFLHRESGGVWRYYSMVRTGRNASRLTTGHESSSINRAVAFYRSLVGIPTDREPPAAR
jgi:hypothetical protein